MSNKLLNLSSVYQAKELAVRKPVFNKLRQILKQQSQSRTCRFFRVPGRCELGGNHTDHNHGLVLTSAIDLDILAAVSPNGKKLIRLYSPQYKKPYFISLENLKRQKTDYHSTVGLVKGLANFLKKSGAKIEGFDAVTSSFIPEGAGLSSSAAFTILIGFIFNALFNDGKISPLKLALLAQASENQFYGKPCGLMDQLACAYGGLLAIDFKIAEKPKIEKLVLDLTKADTALFLINTGESHSALSEAYSSIKLEMERIAGFFKKRFLRQVSWQAFFSKIPELRSRFGDRAVLRAWHFFQENERVKKQSLALKNKDYPSFFKLVTESGNSSFKLLQNCYLPQKQNQQSITLALALTENFLNGEGATRIHGGGFAGTIQSYVPKAKVLAYKKLMEKFFGLNSVFEICLSPIGATELALD